MGSMEASSFLFRILSALTIHGNKDRMMLNYFVNAWVPMENNESPVSCQAMGA
jgi:hypothetical protein